MTKTPPPMVRSLPGFSAKCFFSQPAEGFLSLSWTRRLVSVALPLAPQACLLPRRPAPCGAAWLWRPGRAAELPPLTVGCAHGPSHAAVRHPSRPWLARREEWSPIRMRMEEDLALVPCFSNISDTSGFHPATGIATLSRQFLGEARSPVAFRRILILISSGKRQDYDVKNKTLSARTLVLFFFLALRTW